MQLLFLKKAVEIKKRITDQSTFFQKVIFKAFEKLMSKQPSTFFESIPSTFRCGFRKGFSTQHSLLLTLDKWKKAIQKQPSRRVLRKMCFENMQQIYRRTPMRKSDFRTLVLRHVCSFLNLLRSSRTPFLKNTSGWLLLAIDSLQALGALFTDVSKVFLCLNHKLLIAKLHSHGISFFFINLFMSSTLFLYLLKAS